MLKNSGSKHSNSKESHSNSNSGLFQNLKRLANSNAESNNTGSPTNVSPQQQHSPVEHEAATSPASSSSFRKLNGPSRSISTEARPLNKKSTLNTQNLSQYMNGKISADVPVSSQHARSHSMQSKYSYSKRNSSQASNKLTRQHTGQSHSVSSLLSQGSLTNLSKFTTPDGKIHLEMPSDPYEVEVLFEDIMYKRNIFQSLSGDKQEALMGYSTEKKWLIVKQDLQNELKKLRANTTSSSTASRTSIASDYHPILTANSSLSSPKSVLMTSASSPTSTVYSNSLNHSTTLSSVGTSTSKSKKLMAGGLKKQPSLNNIYRGGSENNTSASTLPGDRTNRPPIHYVQRILADKLTTDEMKDLWVTLRTEQLDWVDAFIDHQGHIAMANVLMNSIYKTAPRDSLTKELLEKENSFFKCFRVLSMLSQGLYEFSTHRLMTDTVAEGLFSTRLATRKMATEIFVCMLEKKNKSRFEAVLTALDKKFRIGQNLHMIQNFKKMPQYFSHLTLESHLKIIQAWLFAVEQTLDGRGKMGSLVGASDEFKNGGGENAILEYCQWTMVFINHLCSCSDNINQRMLLRTKLENCGVLRIMNKIKLLDYDRVMDQIELYDNNKLDDFNVRLEANNKAFNVDLQDPLSLLKNLWDICKGTENEKLLVSLVQHLFLSSSKLIEENQNSSKLTKQLKVMDSLVTSVSIASTSDEESNMNMAIQRLYDAMQTDEVARRAILESRALTKKLEEIQAERDSLSEKLSKAEHGLVGQLEDELHERDRILAKNQRVMQQLEAELEELKKKHLLEKHQQEVELRKMLTILNSRPEENSNINEGIRGKNSSLNSSEKANIQKVLQDGLSRAKKDYKDDSKKFGMTLQPNKRLKMLRMQMENIENEARQLEMTNFAEFEKDHLEPPIQIKKPKLKMIKNKDKKPLNRPQEVDMNKLNDLRRALAEIQMESNDISKFNVEERVNELFNEKKSLALKRLKELETKYKGFGIDFNVEEIMESPKKNSSDERKEGDVNYSSLDPRTYQKKLDEINRITDQLLDLQAQSKQEDDGGVSSLSSSSSSAEGEEVYQDASPNQEIRSKNSELSTGSSSGSFLDALSQKYGTGQNMKVSVGLRDGDYVSGIGHMPSKVEKTFMNKLRKSTASSAPYLEELTQKVNKVESYEQNEDEARSKGSSSSKMTTVNAVPVLDKVEKDFQGHVENREEGSLETREEGIVKNDEKSTAKNLSAMQGSDNVTKAKNISILSSTLPLPPPPPPPPPPVPVELFSNSLEKEKESKDDFAKQDTGSGAVAPPPPPPPPMALFGKSMGGTPPPPPLPSVLSSSAAGPIPPAPPMMPSSQIKSAVTSPLLPQSPSLFEKYPRPHKKLKQLHWEKLDSTDNSIWGTGKAEKFADDLYEKGVLADLEKAFAAREIKSLATKRKEDLQKITFLSRDVSQQFGINLHMYSSLSVTDLVKKILNCDRDFLQTPSVIEFLSKSEIIEVSVNLARNYAPYSTDWEGVKNLKDAKPPEKDPNDLQRADQIYLQLMVNLESYWGSRMRALTVVTSYEKEYNELLTKLRKVDKAVGALQESDNLRNVFNVILAVGNFMNDTSKQAQGFKLSTLQRLTFIKDTTNSMTFLNYVEKIIRLNYPSFNDFLKELEPVLDVVKVSIEQLVNDCRDFSQSIVNVERSVEIGNLSDSSKFHPLDKILIKTLPVLPEARKKGDLLEDEVKLTIMEFESLMHTYGEDSGDKFAKISFFKKFADFINEYKRAQAQNLAAEEEERLYEKHKKIVEEQQKMAQEREKQKENSNSSSSEGNEEDEAEDRRAVMDKLLEQLKNAGPGKSDPSSARKRALVRKKYLSDKDNSQQLLNDLDTEEGSILYSPEAMAPGTDTVIHAESPTPLTTRGTLSIPEDLPSPSKTSTLEDQEEISDRAKMLLKELRGSDTPVKQNSILDEHLEKLRARKERVIGEASAGNKLSFK